MPREARPATAADLKALMEALHREKVEYLLIGGYALFALGYQRGTVDIDLLLPRSSETGERVKRALLALPDKVAHEIEPEWFIEGETIRVADEFIVDLMFNACGESYESLLPHAMTIDLDGVPVHTLNLEGLLKTKQSDREKDRQDRFALEQAIAQAKKQ
ncbi:MAG: nucleotidyl transferase AbiEii/AbiGii toxin family protein [Betaproteobacteria bacterium]